ncbi:uncharacterized protein PV07_11696 [Cladophialophora immunda]|uniref:Uncharacterized protein n=1 Tax=Cladophialophora immunda TaxID=569365 RepID=A0A0D2CJ13_9EURO|nr:uncharacterized protein PV07_11696 [Cladophialophora immunda]KIW23504.1 hypothetical protein PV07_11696 [Cladophialophora immunda]
MSGPVRSRTRSDVYPPHMRRRLVSMQGRIRAVLRATSPIASFVQASSLIAAEITKEMIEAASLSSTCGRPTSEGEETKPVRSLTQERISHVKFVEGSPGLAGVLWREQEYI